MTRNASDPADWFGAVARYSGSDVADAADVFADEVFATIRDGASRTTDDGHHVTLDAQPEIEPNRSWLDRLGLRALERPDGLECPVHLSYEWLPAPFELRGDGTNVGSYGNHDPSNRPENQKIEYIIIHDSEGFFDTTTALAQDEYWVSWHYTLRSSDWHIAQHLKAKDVGWHAGNWFDNIQGITPDFVRGMHWDPGPYWDWAHYFDLL